ncbi:hypothetical protein M23134_04374 [Microscilla marina ATCC 23134]|uniref:Uncharacterized protein n=1 Tax=Microscilla marina ATCC 23134 TaxID=313606 RepID=A1ZLZ5_MICM2|nr:hypothetical protein M23134_04374 [Microscilla marina ATCC 23134]
MFTFCSPPFFASIEFHLLSLHQLQDNYQIIVRAYFFKH